MPEPSSQAFLRELEKKLWTAADQLRSNLEAAVYSRAERDRPTVRSARRVNGGAFINHAVLGLIFLKYVSDSFAQRQAEIEEMLCEPTSDDFLNPKGYGNAFSEEYKEAIRAELEERDYYISASVFKERRQLSQIVFLT